jgi:hypothetical protein
LGWKSAKTLRSVRSVVAVVHVGGIFAFPEESLAGHAFQAFQVDTLVRPAGRRLRCAKSSPTTATIGRE